MLGDRQRPNACAVHLFTELSNVNFNQSIVPLIFRFFEREHGIMHIVVQSAILSQVQFLVH